MATATLAGHRPSVALIAGDAGIGKTRLVAEVADGLRADGVTVAWAACRADGGAPPYWPWAQLLDRLGRPEALAEPQAGDPELARFLLFEAVGRALREVAPVVLVLDDVHWADPPSLKLLEALGAHVGAAPEGGRCCCARPPRWTPASPPGPTRCCWPRLPESAPRTCRTCSSRPSGPCWCGPTAAGTGSRTHSWPTPSPPGPRRRGGSSCTVPRRRRSAGGSGAGVADPAEVAHHQLAAARMSGDPDEARAGRGSGVRWLPAPLFDGPLTRTLSGGSTKAWWCWPICRRVGLRGELLCALGEAALAAGDQARSRVPSRTPRHTPAASPTSGPARRRGAGSDRWCGRVRGRLGGPGPDRAARGSSRCAAHRGLTAALRGVGPAVGRVGLHRGRAAPSRPRRHRRRGGPEAGRPARARRRARRPL